VAVLTSEGKILFWEVEFHQVGVYGQTLAQDDSVPVMLTAHPVNGVGLMSVGEKSKDVREEMRGLSLSDTISPHWFVPSPGEFIGSSVLL
jgi:hypothetical protein